MQGIKSCSNSEQIDTYILLKPNNLHVYIELYILLTTNFQLHVVYPIKLNTKHVETLYPKQLGKDTWIILEEFMLRDKCYVFETKVCCFECLKNLKYQIRNKYMLDEIQNVAHVPDDIESTEEEFKLIRKLKIRA